jgi:hypothetical protein
LDAYLRGDLFRQIGRAPAWAIKFLERDQRTILPLRSDFLKHNLLATFPSDADVTAYHPKGDQDEKSIDWGCRRRRRSLCNPRFGAVC